MQIKERGRDVYVYIYICIFIFIHIHIYVHTYPEYIHISTDMYNDTKYTHHKSLCVTMYRPTTPGHPQPEAGRNGRPGNQSSPLRLEIGREMCPNQTWLPREIPNN